MLYLVGLIPCFSCSRQKIPSRNALVGNKLPLPTERRNNLTGATMDGWMSGWMDGWMDGCVDGWMSGWMDGWMRGWMDEWMDG